jgi:GAF domain
MSDHSDSEPEIVLSGLTLEKSAVQAICTESAKLIADGLSADRIAIVYRTEEGYLTLGGKHEFVRFTLYHNAPISLSVLEDSAIRGRTTLSHDARDDHETPQTLTLQLSEAVSLLCVPFFGSDGTPLGAIYADTTRRVQAFRHKELRFAREFADWLSARLQGENDVAPPKKKIPVKTQAPEDSATKPASSEAGPKRTVPVVAATEQGGAGSKLKKLVGKFERYIFYGQ